MVLLEVEGFYFVKKGEEVCVLGAEKINVSDTII